MPFIGLTGNLGMGKSTVLRLFKALGAYTISADKLVSHILKRPSIINKLTSILGKGVLIKRCGRPSINKKGVADIIFQDPEKRTLIEKVIHPEVIKLAECLKRKIISKKPTAVIVFEVPLLYESHYERIFDKIIVVYCNKEVAISRLMAKGFSKEDALRRMHTQMPISKKKASADFLINNNFNISSTERQVKQLIKKLADFK